MQLLSCGNLSCMMARSPSLRSCVPRPDAHRSQCSSSQHATWSILALTTLENKGSLNSLSAAQHAHPIPPLLGSKLRQSPRLCCSNGLKRLS
ncbi:TPA: hypothetical protein ACH3X3_011305 [Trebouxia sp. C0006]